MPSVVPHRVPPRCCSSGEDGISKQVLPVELSARLLEDIPSRVSPAEEKSYLRQSRGLDEVQSIALSALELALETPGPQQSLNIANAHTKIGKCARFSWDWPTALQHLGKAIDLLTQILAAGRMPLENQISAKRELADARFLRGEVQMARFRQTRSTLDHDNAAVLSNNMDARKSDV